MPGASRSLPIILQMLGPSTAAALGAQLRVSQPTVSRRIRDLGDSIERIGGGRLARYALRREVRGLGNVWPVHRIDARGHPATIGELRALHGGFRFAAESGATWLRDYPEGFFRGLPFFLLDGAPQGFLGLRVARELAAVLHVPVDPRNWSYDDILAYLVTTAHDLPGDLVVGDRNLTRALESAAAAADSAILESARESRYPLHAADGGESPGSSAGGEQPKFLATLSRGGQLVPVIVKFSAAEDSVVSERWRDLLLCEHLVSGVVAARGVPAARSALLDAGGRRFLEVERFDRAGAGGRRGQISLGVLEDALVEATSANWAEAATLLERRGWLDADGARTLRWLWCFGDLIANSDMHRSNAAAFWGDPPPLRIAPVYDMLPMLFAPTAQGELAPMPFRPNPPVPAVADVWPDAAAAAADFWDRVRADPRLSASFRTIAEGCAAEIAAARKRSWIR